MLRSTKITIALLFTAWLVDYLDRIIITFALPEIGHDLSLSHTQQGMIVSAFFLAYAFMQVPGGLLADKYGAMTMGTIGMVGWSVFTGLTALAWSLTAILAIRFLFGLLQGVYPAAAMKALAERCPPQQRATATAWTNSAQTFGSLAAAVVAAIVLPLWGWRVMFAVIAVAGVLVVLAWRRWMPERLLGSDGVDGTDSTDTTSAKEFSWRTAARLLQTPALLGYTVMYLGYGALVWGTTAWVPAYLQEERGLSVQQVALVMAPVMIAGAGGLILGGWLADRLGGRPRRIVIPSMLVTAALLCWLPYTGSVVLFAAVATATTAVAGVTAMSPFAVPMRALPESIIGTAMGIIIFGSQLAGILTPVLLGNVIDTASYAVAFQLLALPCLLAILAAVIVPQNAADFRVAMGSRIAEGEPAAPVVAE